MALAIPRTQINLPSSSSAHNWPPLTVAGPVSVRPSPATSLPSRLIAGSRMATMTSIVKKPERVENSPATSLPTRLIAGSHMETMTSVVKKPERVENSPSTLASRWRELAGERHWAGLLDPMDPDLRRELIRYGEMAQACYDAFDYDAFSRYCGSCKYPRRRFFEELGMPSAGYEVTRYLYATSNLRLPRFLTRSRWPKTWTETGNWIGYVSVSDDEETARIGRRDVLVAWRGTVTNLEWLADLSDFLRPVAAEGIPCPDPRVMVEAGFVDLYTDQDPSCRFCRSSARDQVLREVRRLVRLHSARGEQVSVSMTGHSLGSALATLCAYDVVESGASADAPVTVYSFSGPRVGNRRFKERLEGELGVRVVRVLNVHDAVPKVPGVVANEETPAALRWVAERVLPWWCYRHVGVELKLDHERSPFLRETRDPVCSHNLEAHLHLLDGYHGKEAGFATATGRDPALVNKACDFLRDELLVPPFWRQDENKGMVVREGRWVLPEREVHDHEHPHFEEPADVAGAPKAFKSGGAANGFLCRDSVAWG